MWERLKSGGVRVRGKCDDPGQGQGGWIGGGEGKDLKEESQ
jgi:hypothetical protein